MKKKKILVLSDHPLAPSGVGTQTKYMIEALLKTGRYSFVCLGGAVSHNSYQPQKVDPYGDDWVIFPVDGYGNPEVIRSILRKERPDALWFMTDPRFWGWLWNIEDEIRALVPMVYYHVWDNYPAPYFNKNSYESCDEIACISKVTHEIVKEVAPDVNSYYVPHAVDSSVFRPAETEVENELVEKLRNKIISQGKYQNPKKKIFFWNNRNARRKHSGTLIWWFKEYLDQVGHDKATLLMHTDPRDPHGQDLPHIISHLGVGDGQVFISSEKIGPHDLANMYRAADCTINISDAEGFGLATLESLACGTPIIVNMTGGLQEQVTNGKDWFGIGIEPSAKAIIGSLQVPYIYEDRISRNDFLAALKKMSKMPKKSLNAMSKRGLKHIHKNYSFEKFQKQWVELMDDIIENHGSWEDRKNYKRWHLLEVA